MKFLRNTATDFFAHRASFLFLSGSPEFKSEGEIINKETAQQNLHLDTQERMDMLGYEAQYLKAANEANKSVNDKLPKFWTALQGLSTPATEEQVRPIAGEYLVNKTLPTPEMRKMYRTEMFASFRATLSDSANRATLPNFTDADISTLLLSGMSQVYTYPEHQQTVEESLKTASRMIKYDKDHSGINVTEWVSGGKSIMSYQSEMQRSAVQASVNDAGQLVINGKAYDITGCEILTGAAMMDYPVNYLQKFVFQNLIVKGNRVMARVENGCHGNLATFALAQVPVLPVTPDIEKENKEIPGNCDIQKPEIVSDCEADECKHEFTEIWNGIEGGDPKALESLKERTGIAVESATEAREIFVKLYGQKEWIGVEKDGIYTVLEKHYNPKSGVPLWNSIKEIFGNKSLADTFREAGYENADELAEKFTGAVAGYENINSNAAKFAAVAEDKHDGATVDALIRIGAGAVIAVGMAAALGTPLTAPLVLAGVPLMKFRTGIKRFEKTTSVNKIAALFLNPEATVEDFEDCCGEVQDVPVAAQEKSYTYIELQKKAIGDAEIVSYLAKDAIDANVALKRGPYQTPMVDITPEEEALYKAQAESISETKGDIDKVLDELAKNGYYFEEGAEHEADYASRAKKFKLGRLGLSLTRKTSVETSEGMKTMSIRNAFDFYMGQATSSLGFKSRKESYEKAMDLLVGQFNTVAQDELDTVWGKNEKLTLVSLDKAFRYGKEFDLGALPNKEKYDRERRLCVKFRPTTPGQPNNTEAEGTWVMYVKEITNGEVYTTREVEYRSASALIGKKEKHITLDDIATLGGSKENMYSNQEQREILNRLDFFDLMVGQMAQMNETKDQMELSTSNKKVMNELTRIESLLGVNMRCKGTEVETQEQYQYRVAVGAKLAKYKNFAEFKAGVEKFGDIYKFSPAVMEKIEKVYTGESTALDSLVANKEFQTEMALFTQRMECINEYLTLDDLDACAAYVQRHTYFSGETAMRQSTNATVSFGDVYILYLIGKGLMNQEVSKIITDTIEYTTGAKNEAGQLIVYTMEMEKEIMTKIPVGYSKETVRKAIVALFGGRISNQIIDHWKNTP